ncbi:MAG: addiction module protein [Bacteroidota bacterium]
MSLQYITDDKGQTTGVFIPIQEWNNIKSRYKDIDQDIPDWHKEIIDQRMKDYKQNPDQAMDFDLAMDEIESDL